MRLALRTKLVIAVTIPALLICTVVLSVTTLRLRARAILKLEENATRIAGVYADRLGAELESVAMLNRSLGAYLEQHSELSEEGLQAVLDSGLAAGGLVETVAFFQPGSTATGLAQDMEPRLLLATAAHTGEPALARWREISQVPEWFREAAEAGGSRWLPAPVDDATHHPSRVVHALLWRNQVGEPLGASAIEIDIGHLRQRMGTLLTETGLAIIDGEGTYLYHPDLSKLGTRSIYVLAAREGRPDMALLGQRMSGGESGVMRMRQMVEDGYQWVVYAPVPGTDWSFVYAVPEARVLAFPNSQLWVGAIIAGVGLFLIAGFVYMVAVRSTARLSGLVDAVNRIAGGDLGVRVDEVQANDEIGDLARSFNRMVGDLRRYMETHTRELAAREAVESELRVARRIQNSLLPGRFPAFPDRPEFQLHAVNMPAAKVAGDFFDFFLRDERTLVVVMADVSGKGIPASLFMAVARTVIRNLTPHCDGPAATLRRANEVLREDNMGSMYVTLFLGWYDTVSGHLRYANAGHPAPYLVGRSGQAVTCGPVTGSILGILPDLDYTDGEIRLDPGESLVLYTDGLYEARDLAGEFFGFERLARLIESQASEPVDRLCEGVAESVSRFQDNQQRDDITLLALRRSLRASHQAA